MKKVFRILLYLFIAFVVILGVSFLVLDEELPAYTEGPEADELALKMEEAVGKAAFDSTRYISWYFAGIHHYVLDKQDNTVIVSYGDNVAYLNLNDLDKSSVIAEKKVVEGEAKSEYITKAWNYYNNDSFWLFAPFKAFDPGVSRGIVVNEDGSKSLLVKYSSGGSTPGDAYLWHLDEDYRPKSFQIWASIVPIRGLTATWQNWVEQEHGFQLVSFHRLGIIKFSISKIKSGKKPTDIGMQMNSLDQ